MIEMKDLCAVAIEFIVEEVQKLKGRALKMRGSTSEYRGNFREAEAVIILTDANIRHSLNSSPVHEPDEYPDGIELQIRTLLRRSFSFF